MARGYYLICTHSVLLLLPPLKLSYEAAKRRAEPCTTIVAELPEMRRETVQFVRQGRQPRSPRLCVGQPSGWGECAIDAAGTVRDAMRL